MDENASLREEGTWPLLPHRLVVGLKILDTVWALPLTA